MMKKTMEWLIKEKPADDVIYYINWEPFSLINVDIFQTASFMKKRDCRVFCKSLYQLSEGAKAKKMFSLSQCLQHISDCHSLSKETAHILIDEYDEEELTKDEAKAINEILHTSPVFMDAIVSVSVQSLEKKRENYLPKAKIPTATGDEKGQWREDCGMAIFELQKSMRFTTRINSLVSNFQQLVVNKPSVYHLYEDSKFLSSEQTVVDWGRETRNSTGKLQC